MIIVVGSIVLLEIVAVLPQILVVEVAPAFVVPVPVVLAVVAQNLPTVSAAWTQTVSVEWPVAPLTKATARAAVAEAAQQVNVWAFHEAQPASVAVV